MTNGRKKKQKTCSCVWCQAPSTVITAALVGVFAVQKPVCIYPATYQRTPRRGEGGGCFGWRKSIERIFPTLIQRCHVLRSPTQVCSQRTLRRTSRPRKHAHQWGCVVGVVVVVRQAAAVRVLSSFRFEHARLRSLDGWLVVGGWQKERRASYFCETLCRQKKRKKTETGLKRCKLRWWSWWWWWCDGDGLQHLSTGPTSNSIIIISSSSSGTYDFSGPSSTPSSSWSQRCRIVFARLSLMPQRQLRISWLVFFVIALVAAAFSAVFCYQKCIETTPNGRLVVVVFFSLCFCRIPIYFPWYHPYEDGEASLLELKMQ